MTVTVTSKGQVTVPKQVRDRLGIKPGSKVDFELDEDGRAFLRKVGKRTVKPSRFERMRLKPQTPSASICGLRTVDPMAAIWQRHHLSALAVASLFAAVASSLGNGWVAIHSVRAATSGSTPLFHHHDASSLQRWISR